MIHVAVSATAKLGEQLWLVCFGSDDMPTDATIELVVVVDINFSVAKDRATIAVRGWDNVVAHTSPDRLFTTLDGALDAVREKLAKAANAKQEPPHE